MESQDKTAEQLVDDFVVRPKLSAKEEFFVIRETGDGTSVVEMFPELDDDLIALQTQLKTLAVKGVNNNFIINCEKIKRINSKAIGMLMGIKKLLSERGCNLVLCNVKNKFVFDLIGASRILKIYDTEIDALSALRLGFDCY